MRRGVIMIIMLASIVGAWFVVRDRSSSDESTKQERSHDSTEAIVAAKGGSASEVDAEVKKAPARVHRDIEDNARIESRVTKIASNTSGTIEVVVRFPDGAPAAGMWIHTRKSRSRFARRAGRLDASGAVTLQRVRGEQVRVIVSTEKSTRTGVELGEVDVTKNDWRIEATIRRPREVVFHVTLDGRPGIPPDLSVQRADIFLSWRDACPVEIVDEAKGIVRVDWMPVEAGEIRSVALKASGWVLDESQSAIELKDVESKTETRSVNFVRSATIELRVLEHECERPKVLLQRWEPLSASWEIRECWDRSSSFVGNTARVTVGSLLPGRSRFVSDTGGGASEEVELHEGQTAQLTFDLSNETVNIVRVELPEGTSPRKVQVQVHGCSFAHRNRVFSVDRRFVKRYGPYSFLVTASGSEEVTLIPVCSGFIPAPNGGTAAFRLPRDDVILKMVPGPLVVARLAPLPPLKGTGSLSAEMLAFKGEVTSRSHARVIPVHVEGDVLTSRSLPPGTWTLWIDIKGYAPVTLKDVVVAESGLDLGTLNCSKGSTFRVRHNFEGSQPSQVVLQSLAGPRKEYKAYDTRGLVEISGLPEGWYRAHLVRWYKQHRGLSNHSELGVIKLDGKSTVEKIIDLR